MYCSTCRVARSPEDLTRTANDSGEIVYACTACETPLQTTHLCGPCGGVEKSAIATLNGSGQIVRCCPTCQNPMGLALSKPLAATGKDVGGDANEATRATEYIAPHELIARGGRAPSAAPAAGPAARTSRMSARAPQAQQAGPLDIEGTIRARLAELESEIALRKGLEVEAKTLRKTLAAFERASLAASARIRITTLLAPTTDTQN